MPFNVTLRMGAAVAQIDERNPRILIGRDRNHCGLVTDDPSCSRRHAEVYIEAGSAYIRDLGSSNGTWVDGASVAQQPAQLGPGKQVYVGYVPLVAEISGGADAGATVMGEMPPDLVALMQQRFEQAKSQGFGAAPPPGPAAAPSAASAQPSYQMPAYQPRTDQPAAPAAPVAAPAPTAAPASTAAPAPSGGLGVGGSEAPIPADMAYRRQGSNSNGVLLIALPGDTFQNDSMCEGYLEYTAMDDETVASITIELVECHKKGPKNGHVWDRMLVRQGPWKSRKGDVLPMPFKLRIPPGTSVTGRDVHWELRGYVDINWAFDVEASSPIIMRNIDVERVRDALGALDYRIVELEPKPLGQQFIGKFQPPAQLSKQIGISDINLVLEYLGSNLQVKFEVEKTSFFKFDKRTEFVFELSRLRAVPLPELSQHFKEQIDLLMAK